MGERYTPYRSDDWKTGASKGVSCIITPVVITQELHCHYHRLLLHLEVQQLLTIILQTMSSSNNNNIATHVPILNGTNYREWESQMKGYLQSQGLWRVANGMVTRPADNQPVEQAKWDILDDMVQDALTLRISPNCRNHVGATSAETWTALETAYGQVGISRIYGDFKALVSFRLSGTQHPAAEMERFNTSLQRLVANGIDLPDNIVGLMYISVKPPFKVGPCHCDLFAGQERHHRNYFCWCSLSHTGQVRKNQDQ